MRFDLLLGYLILPLLLVLSVLGVPTSIHVRGSESQDSVQKRTTPFFPDQPPSCPICAKDYPSINGCAEAAPVLQNFTNIIFNPGAFIDVIRCACVDTFQAVFPQCVDCFIRTGQENVLNTPNLPAVVDGMKKVCVAESALLGNVSETDGEATPSVSPPAPSPTSGAAAHSQIRATMTLIVTVLGICIGSLVL